MPKPVPDIEDNLKVCRKSCGLCPSFKLNKLNEFEPHVLFCARGKTSIPKEQVVNKGCSCFGCELFSKYELEKGYFCMPWKQK
ncbi:MAG: DUF2769 domain-containing protein [Promethearchaeota archaeon]